MTIQIDNNYERVDLSLLALEAAEELERYRHRLPTNFKSVNALSMLLEESFGRKVDDSPLNFRLDHASVFTSAIQNSLGSSVKKKSISEIANEAVKIASRLNSNTINSKDEELKNLVSFCIALSDSAALYKEELEELKKHFA